MGKLKTNSPVIIDCTGSNIGCIHPANGDNQPLNSSQKKALFLDDFRIPKDVLQYHEDAEHLVLYEILNWHVVKSYTEFVQFIKINGLPDIVSFDHDLHQEHYSPLMFDEASYNALYKTFKEKTGFDAAKWLMRYIKRNKISQPIIYCHSRNPTGKKNILSLFNY